MKPLMLHGHERPITQIKYNREGDLLFSAAKDTAPNVWYSLNGERLGTFQGHSGAVWCLDVDWDTDKLVTGAGDNMLKIWDCSNGKEMTNVEAKSTVRTCVFSYCGNLVAFSTDTQRKQICEIVLIDVRTADSQGAEPILSIPVPDSKVTALQWGSLNEKIVTGHENGKITQWDIRMEKLTNQIDGHNGPINDMQMYRDGMMFVTASSDHTAKLFDTEELTHLKTYHTERPVNSASLSPLYEHVVLGGGQEASLVTTTSTRIGKFDARFFHVVFEEEFGRVKGHFGPINSLAFHPDGRSYASGGEDGYVRLQSFDQSYFDYNFDF
ncbi:eukaryotic translation initiation factor 3 subunit I [Cimex lectularius]|uniref:Eukaryotic translation initiation factor 3 subunit I n=1 Tax=Cimex lectularius TaxID=79782 RepID=A0A8I6RH65_CIMLE|nr:eukaryotic translation initiation factor 3 subunit I [Cimex lectularius]